MDKEGTDEDDLMGIGIGQRYFTRPPTPRGHGKQLVLHAVPTKYKLGEVRRWLEEDNRYLPTKGARWLLTEGWRLRKSNSSVVLYLQDPIIPSSLRLGRKALCTATYDWYR